MSSGGLLLDGFHSMISGSYFVTPLLVTYQQYRQLDHDVLLRSQAPDAIYFNWRYALFPFEDTPSGVHVGIT